MRTNGKKKKKEVYKKGQKKTRVRIMATHHFHKYGKQLGNLLELRRLERFRRRLLPLALRRRLRRFPGLVRGVSLLRGAGVR